jgi:hypothetical protein
VARGPGGEGGRWAGGGGGRGGGIPGGPRRGYPEGGRGAVDGRGTSGGRAVDGPGISPLDTRRPGGGIPGGRGRCAGGGAAARPWRPRNLPPGYPDGRSRGYPEGRWGAMRGRRRRQGGSPPDTRTNGRAAAGAAAAPHDPSRTGGPGGTPRGDTRTNTRRSPPRVPGCPRRGGPRTNTGGPPAGYPDERSGAPAPDQGRPERGYPDDPLRRDTRTNIFSSPQGTRTNIILPTGYPDEHFSSPPRTRTNTFSPPRTRTNAFSPPRTRTNTFSPPRTRTNAFHPPRIPGSPLFPCFHLVHLSSPSPPFPLLSILPRPAYPDQRGPALPGRCPGRRGPAALPASATLTESIDRPRASTRSIDRRPSTVRRRQPTSPPSRARNRRVPSSRTGRSRPTGSVGRVPGHRGVGGPRAPKSLGREVAQRPGRLVRLHSEVLRHRLGGSGSACRVLARDGFLKNSRWVGISTPPRRPAPGPRRSSTPVRSRRGPAGPVAPRGEGRGSSRSGARRPRVAGHPGYPDGRPHDGHPQDRRHPGYPDARAHQTTSTDHAGAGPVPDTRGYPDARSPQPERSPSPGNPGIPGGPAVTVRRPRRVVPRSLPLQHPRSRWMVGWGGQNKSGAEPADAQEIVTTRLLCSLHDRRAQLSRLQRIHPRALSNCNPSASGTRFQGPAVADLLRSMAEAYSYPPAACGRKSSRSGTDSNLEAFSYNPADGSVAALPGRTAAKTNYLNPRFLSY